MKLDTDNKILQYLFSTLLIYPSFVEYLFFGTNQILVLFESLLCMEMDIYH